MNFIGVQVSNEVITWLKQMSDEVTDVYIGFVCFELNCITVKYLLIRSCYTQSKLQVAFEVSFNAYWT